MTRSRFAAVLIAAALVFCAIAQNARAQTPPQPPAQSPAQSSAPSEAPGPSEPSAQSSLPGPSVDRNVRAMPGSDVRVGIYTSIRQDCTSGPLPAIRLV